MPLEDLVIYRKRIPESEPVFCEFPQSLHPEIQEFLKKQNILALYSHQAEMFQARRRKTCGGSDTYGQWKIPVFLSSGDQ